MQLEFSGEESQNVDFFSNLPTEIKWNILLNDDLSLQDCAQFSRTNKANASLILSPEFQENKIRQKLCDAMRPLFNDWGIYSPHAELVTCNFENSLPQILPKNGQSLRDVIDEFRNAIFLNKATLFPRNINRYGRARIIGALAKKNIITDKDIKIFLDGFETYRSVLLPGEDDFEYVKILEKVINADLINKKSMRKIWNIISTHSSDLLHNSNSQECAIVFKALALGGLIDEGSINSFLNMVRACPDDFLQLMGGINPLIVITLCGPAKMTTVEAVNEFTQSVKNHESILFSPDLQIDHRTLICLGLLEGGIITKESIREFSNAIARNEDGLFSDIHNSDNKELKFSVKYFLAKNGLKSYNTIQAITRLFTVDMDANARTQIIMGLGKGGLKDFQDIEKFIQFIDCYKSILFRAMDNNQRASVIAGLAITGAHECPDIEQYFVECMEKWYQDQRERMLDRISYARPSEGINSIRRLITWCVKKCPDVVQQFLQQIRAEQDSQDETLIEQVFYTIYRYHSLFPFDMTAKDRIKMIETLFAKGFTNTEDLKSFLKTVYKNQEKLFPRDITKDQWLIMVHTMIEFGYIDEYTIQNLMVKFNLNMTIAERIKIMVEGSDVWSNDSLLYP